MTTSVKHFVLVPGFGGFDALGAIDYYEDVVKHLQKGTNGARVHFFPNLPTAAVNTRAEELAVYLAKRLHRGSITPGEEIHLVAHSTGGLDVRQMIANLRDPETRPADESGTITNKQILDAVKSIQFLSVPQRGTNIAYRLAPRWIASRVGVGSLFAFLYCGRPLLARAFANVLRLKLRPSDPRDWIDALLDTVDDFKMSGKTPRQQAEARESLYATLKWLENMAADGAAIEDLQPNGPGVKPTKTPARWDEKEQRNELDFYKNKGIRIQSFITAADPRANERDLYFYLHEYTGAESPDTMGGTFTIPRLNGKKDATITLAANDGIVNAISMHFPAIELKEAGYANYFVDADHGDIIGHFNRKHDAKKSDEYVYDLLRSGADFREKDFKEVWEAIGAFASAEKDLANVASRPARAVANL